MSDSNNGGLVIRPLVPPNNVQDLDKYRRTRKRISLPDRVETLFDVIWKDDEEFRNGMWAGSNDACPNKSMSHEHVIASLKIKELAAKLEGFEDIGSMPTAVIGKALGVVRWRKNMRRKDNKLAPRGAPMAAE